MHVIIKDPNGKGIEAAMCLDRDSRTCYVLQSDIDQLDNLVAIARAQKVPEVRLVVPHDAVEELQASGWKVSNTLVVLTKGPKDGV